VITTNAIYHCEELEDNVSVYDTIVEENEYADLKEEQPADGVYLDFVGDETEKYDQDTKPPELPKPRPETTSQDEDRGYEGLEGEKPDHLYIQLVGDEAEGSYRRTKTQDQVRDTNVQDQDNRTEDRGQEQDTKAQD